MNKPFALIIEDDPKLGKIFSLTLESVDFDTELVTEGNAALCRLEETVPALVILDLHLPQVSGEEILQRIRSEERFADSHVILATADALKAEKLRGKADVVLLKPISINQLSKLARRLHANITSAS